MRIRPSSLERVALLASVDWDKISKSVAVDNELSPSHAEFLVESFVRRYCKAPLLSLLLPRRYGNTDDLIVVSLCKSLHADRITLIVPEQGLPGVPLVQLGKKISLGVPGRRGKKESAKADSCALICTVRISRLLFQVRTRWGQALMTLLLWGAITSLYMLLGALVIYGMAILALFVLKPHSVVFFATEKPSLLLACVCVLSAVAALANKLIVRLLVGNRPSIAIQKSRIDPEPLVDSQNRPC